MAPGIDIAAFLRNKAAIPFIHAFAQENGVIVEEIHRQLDVSRQTVTNLIDEAHEKDVIRRVYSDEDHRNAKRYELTKRGMRIYVKTKETGVYETYRELKQLEEQYENQRGEVEEWADDTYFDPTSLREPDWDEIEWKDLRPPDEGSDTDEDE